MIFSYLALMVLMCCTENFSCACKLSCSIWDLVPDPGIDPRSYIREQES